MLFALFIDFFQLHLSDKLNDLLWIFAVLMAFGGGLAIAALILVPIVYSAIAGLLNFRWKESPDEPEKSECDRTPWWARFLLNSLFIALYSTSTVVASALIMILVEPWDEYDSFPWPYESSNSTLIQTVLEHLCGYNNMGGLYLFGIAIVGAVLGGAITFWFTRRKNLKRSQKWNNGILKGCFVGIFCGPVVLLTLFSFCGINIRYHMQEDQKAVKESLNAKEFQRYETLLWESTAPHQPLDDDWLKTFRGLDTLQVVELNGPQIDDKFIDYLIEKRSLHGDYVRTYEVEGILIQGIYPTIHLGDKTTITSIGLQKLAVLNLSQLSIPYRLMTDANLGYYLNALAILENPSVLQLTGWQITDRGLEHLTNRLWIEELKFGGGFGRTKRNITDNGLKYLEKLVNLRVLELQGQNITDAGLVHLKGLKNLEKVNLGHSDVTKAGIAELQKALPDCEIIH